MSDSQHREEQPRMSLAMRIWCYVVVSFGIAGLAAFAGASDEICMAVGYGLLVTLPLGMRWLRQLRQAAPAVEQRPIQRAAPERAEGVTKEGEPRRTLTGTLGNAEQPTKPANRQTDVEFGSRQDEAETHEKPPREPQSLPSLEAWIDQRQSREIDYRAANSKTLKKEPPPSKTLSGPVFERLRAAEWCEGIRNVWGGDFGWGASTEKEQRWRRLMERHGIDPGDGSHGCLISCHVNPIGLVPHPYVPPTWMLNDKSHFEPWCSDAEGALKVSRTWQNENGNDLTEVLRGMLGDLGVSVAGALHYHSAGYVARIAVRMDGSALDAFKASYEDRWVSQKELVALVREHHPDAVAEHSPSWLGQMRLDVFIPSLNVAIEYQGEQHHRPVPYFGGEKAYKRTVERDKRKRDLCEEHGIRMVYWDYNEPITHRRLKRKLQAL